MLKTPTTFVPLLTVCKASLYGQAPSQKGEPQCGLCVTCAVVKPGFAYFHTIDWFFLRLKLILCQRTVYHAASRHAPCFPSPSRARIARVQYPPLLSRDTVTLWQASYLCFTSAALFCTYSTKSMLLPWCTRMLVNFHAQSLTTRLQVRSSFTLV